MLMTILLPVLIILSSMAINIAYMELTRTELMVATDAAARAGGRAMSFYQDVDLAKQAAQTTGAMNTVAGQALTLSIEDSFNQIEFGDCEPLESSDRYDFVKLTTGDVSTGEQSANAIRVNSSLNDVAMLFPTIATPMSSFNVNLRAVAMQVDRDILLVLDRSGSMSYMTYNWPPGVSPWSYSSLNQGVQGGKITFNGHYYAYASGQNSKTYQDWLYEEALNLGTPPNSPWDDLNAAVDTFLRVLEDTDQNELVALSTYASSASLDLTLQSDYDVVRSKLSGLEPSGATAIGSGMITGTPSLTGGDARPFAAKTIIVMTDGIHNTGTSPESAAQNIVADNDVTIHTVTFGSGADTARMQSVAQIGGGTHYHAATGAELVDVFEQIANNLPTIVTE